jgi:hypothetical protein
MSTGNAPDFAGENRPADYVSCRMKSFWMICLLALAVCAFGGCASTDSTAKTGDPVPGETKADDQRLVPGAASPGSASVRW